MRFFYAFAAIALSVHVAINDYASFLLYSFIELWLGSVSSEYLGYFLLRLFLHFKFFCKVLKFEVTDFYEFYKFTSLRIKVF